MRPPSSSSFTCTDPSPRYIYSLKKGSGDYWPNFVELVTLIDSKLTPEADFIDKFPYLFDIEKFWWQLIVEIMTSSYVRISFSFNLQPSSPSPVAYKLFRINTLAEETTITYTSILGPKNTRCWDTTTVSPCLISEKT